MDVDYSSSDDNEFADLDPKSFVLAEPMADGDDVSDNEVEIAINAGLVDARNLPYHRRKTPLVNKVAQIKRKIDEIKNKKLPFIARVAVNSSPDLVYTKEINDDFAREALFFKQAQNGALQAIKKLKELNIPVERPEDYFAQMVKTDKHMHRVRGVLQNKQKEKERRETVRRLRTEKKFASKVQKETEQQQRTEKRKFLEAVKKHRKGMKGQLETMLNNAKSMGMDDDDLPDRPQRGGKGAKGSKLSRTARNKKFGFGGKKRNSKRNDKASFNDIGGGRRGIGKKGGSKFGRKR